VGYQIKEDEMDWGIGRVWENRNMYRFLVGNTDGKRPLGRRRPRRENNTKLNLTGARDEPRIAVSSPTKIRAGRREIGFRFSVEKRDSLFPRCFRPLRVPPRNLANSLSLGQNGQGNNADH
jgi:hypothetical protein